MLKNSLIELRQLPKNKQKMLPEQKKKVYVFMYFV